ncbi:MAG: SDR family oxidoreductase [Thermodesulfobacteriota bacterium]|nr:SDR family oxidoreductase [Thermodesulfobacteriota bacterium]
MDLKLEGKVAFVGGASKGLGRATAAALADEGAKVVISARNRETLRATAGSISRETGNEVMAAPADLSRPDQVRAAIKDVLDDFGRVDILVNNAGGPPVGAFMEFTDEAWEAAFRLNLMSAVTLAREVVPGMKDRRWGRIINLTSIAVKQPLGGLILSNSIRAGVHGWAKSLSNELAPLGITVNNILPGYTLTDRVRSLARTQAEKEGTKVDEMLARMEEVIPMKRLGKPEDVGGLVAFLASEQAGYITGASIQIDGGFYAGLM